MQPLRRLLLSHRAIAALVIAFALVMRIVTPAGFMPVMADGQIVVSVCSGAGATTMVVTIPGMKHGDGALDDDKQQPTCAFAGLSMPGLSGADPLVLALAILFVLAMALRPAAVLRIERPQFLRPPLRAPPTTA